jgi:hypothetical protein
MKREFRAWLVDRLADTNHANCLPTTPEFKRLAKQLGVTLATLEEAHRLRVSRAENAGFTPPLGQKKTGSGHYQAQVWFAPELYPIWTLRCEEFGAQPSAVVRSLIHAYLLGSREPKLARGWYWDGVYYAEERKNAYWVAALISQGARYALQRRARSVGTTPHTIHRALCTEFMEGRWPKLTIVDAKTMWHDPDRYFTR